MGLQEWRSPEVRPAWAPAASRNRAHSRIKSWHERPCISRCPAVFCTGADFPRRRDRTAGAGRASLCGTALAPRRRGRLVQWGGRGILREADAGFPRRFARLRDIQADAGARVASRHRARSVHIERRPDGHYLAEIYGAWRLQDSADRERALRSETLE